MASECAPKIPFVRGTFASSIYTRRADPRGFTIAEVTSAGRTQSAEPSGAYQRAEATELLFFVVLEVDLVVRVIVQVVLVHLGEAVFVGVIFVGVVIIVCISVV